MAVLVTSGHISVASVDRQSETKGETMRPLHQKNGTDRTTGVTQPSLILASLVFGYSAIPVVLWTCLIMGMLKLCHGAVDLILNDCPKELDQFNDRQPLVKDIERRRQQGVIEICN
jgi:hypothetical protein